MKQLNPKAVWLFFFSYFFVVLFLTIWLGGFGLSFVMQGFLGGSFLFSDLLISGLIVFAVAVGLSYIIARFSYHFYRYELREDCFRKESGIIWKRYVSIPYERIQNVDIHRGIIARLLGLSDLQIQTAGSSAVVYGRGMRGISAEGRLPGVSQADAEILRDELVQRAKGARTGI